MILRRINIRIIVYLDGMLLISQTIWFALTTVGAHNKFEKVSTISDPEIGIIGARNRLSHHDFNLINGKSVHWIWSLPKFRLGKVLTDFMREAKFRSEYFKSKFLLCFYWPIQCWRSFLRKMKPFLVKDFHLNFS